MKWRFRRIMLRKKLDKDKVKLKEIVDNIASETDVMLRQRCALNGWKMLSQGNK